ncbi:MAG TPA: MBL fold metallo-hydrolase [Polyangia bacterium]|jgi:glyoxylase-like metal-dependent hydrolase (beta-lactamase superfamily II)|nr:MBL fold metallo-hydrolase [Polyangia bacterium]HVZ20963.1 MBL fold metallo-hydrolase [Vicinamibacterales bacterium]
MLTIGDARLTMVNGGNFRLDGGAMHGVVPKTLWSKLVSCDAQNRCEYTTRCLLVEVPEGKATRRILIETGNGDKFAPKLKDIYGINHDRSIGDALREIGVAPDSIDTVVMTHLHFDHSGGTTRRSASGALEPVFKNAKHVVQRLEWEDASHPHERNRASYLGENIGPLGELGLLQLVDGETEIAPGVRVVPTPGHTRGHQSVLIGSQDRGAERAIFLGDVVPTAVHTRLPWVMAYDLDPVRTLETKRALFRRAVEENWLTLWGHDPDHMGGRLGVDKDGNFVVRELVSI